MKGLTGEGVARTFLHAIRGVAYTGSDEAFFGSAAGRTAGATVVRIVFCNDASLPWTANLAHALVTHPRGATVRAGAQALTCTAYFSLVADGVTGTAVLTA